MADTKEQDPPTDVERERLWLADRRTAITATDAAAILGLSKFASPIDVWLDKTGKKDDVPRTEQQESGHRFQRPILTWYADRERAPIAFADPYSFTRSLDNPLIGASLDAWRTDDSRPVDAKNIGYPQAGEWGVDGTDQMPLYYAVQLVMQMHVMRESTCADLAVVFRGQKLEVFRLLRDRALEENIVGKCLDFHEKYVKTDTPPPVDGTEGWSNYLKAKFKSNTDAVLDATPELDEVAANLHAARTAAKQFEDAIALHTNRLKDVIGSARTLRGKTWAATWAKTKDGETIDHEQVARTLALKIAELTGRPFGPVLAEAVAAATSTKLGHKRFTFTFDE